MSKNDNYSPWANLAAAVGFVLLMGGLYALAAFELYLGFHLNSTPAAIGFFVILFVALVAAVMIAMEMLL